MLHVVDNFFEDFQFLKDAFKNIKLYDLKSYNEKFKTSDCWPGLRSQELFDYHPFLAFYFLFKSIFIESNP